MNAHALTAAGVTARVLIEVTLLNGLIEHRGDASAVRGAKSRSLPTLARARGRAIPSP